MTKKAYYELVERFEKEAEASPSGFRWKALGIASAGYGVLLGLLVVLAFCLWRVGLHLFANGVGAIPLVLAIVLGLGFISLLRCLFFRIPMPFGILLGKADFPWLHEQVKDLRKPLKLGRKSIQLVATDDFNAAAVQVPRFGFFGPSKRYLLLGLPLIASLNAQQLRSLLAHELAHLSRRHGPVTLWIGRVRATWIQFLEKLAGSRILSLLVGRFTDFYAPRFEAAAAVLSRSQEFEADRLAAQAVGAESCAQTLLRIEARASIVEQDQENLWRQAWGSELVPPAAVSRLTEVSSTQLISYGKAQKSIARALGDATLVHDSHPCLADRLRAIDVELPAGTDDLDHFLRESGVYLHHQELAKFLDKKQDDLLKQSDQLWIDHHSLPWAARHLQGRFLTEMLERLKVESRHLRGRLSEERLWKMAWLKAELTGLEKAKEIVAQVIEANPQHAGANFFLGRSGLEDGDAEGIVAMETAMREDPYAYREIGHGLLSDFYRRQGDLDRARQEMRASFEAADLQAKADKERSAGIRVRDSFLPHTLTEEQLDDLRYTFAAVPEIKKVYLVFRDVEFLPESPFHLLGIVAKPVKGEDSDAWKMALAGALAYSKSLHIRHLGKSSILMRMRVAKVKGALIYDSNTSDKFRYAID